MVYDVRFSKRFSKQFSKLDKLAKTSILNWIEKRLKTENPRAFGKALKGNLAEYWRYRIGNYRLVAKIEDKELIIIMIAVGDRKRYIQRSLRGCLKK